MRHRLASNSQTGPWQPATWLLNGAMPLLALISDIHVNHVALTEVLRDIANQDIDQIYCLGDVVGYGPQPVESMITVLKVCESGKMIAGNHDNAVLLTVCWKFFKGL